jgi:hypothetical protein
VLGAPGWDGSTDAWDDFSLLKKGTDKEISDRIRATTDIARHKPIRRLVVSSIYVMKIKKIINC